ncbi:MAG: HigA family addiction module antidote protein [Bradymonadales bacterium]|nr:HigA family addiction module antidote protein [Bradymonadales bacterium]
MSEERFAPVHPGEILQEEFLVPLGISQYRLAKDIHVPPRRINEIVHGTRAISADTALRLARYFGLTERFWMNLQARYDLEVAKDKLGDRLESEVQPRHVGV